MPLTINNDPNADVSKLQIVITTTENVTDFPDANGSYTGTRTTTQNTYIADLQKQSDDLNNQIIGLQAQKDAIDANIADANTQLQAIATSRGVTYTPPSSTVTQESTVTATPVAQTTTATPI